MPDKAPLILICEESETYFTLERHLLDRHGYYAIGVLESALLAEVRRQNPKLVILGLTAKGAPLELAIELRGNPATRGTSVLATGIRGHITRDEIIRRGANGLLWKPFSPERFMREVERLISIPERHRIQFDVRLRRNKPRARVIKGTSVNLSEAGILLYAERPLEVEEIYLLEGSVTRGGFALECEVVRQASEIGPGYYALRFRQPRDVVRQAMDTFGLVPSAIE